MDRRSFNIGMAAAAAVAASKSLAASPAAPAPAVPTGGKRLQIGMIIFDGMTNQDFVGAHDMFAAQRSADTHVLAKTRAPITTDRRLQVLPHMAIEESPDLDILFVGGGPGSTALMTDPEVIDFVKQQGERAQYVTSVCSGALVLGAAGLLRGYKAATHWAAMEILPILGATPVYERVVFDRNRFTGGGVTAGIDFGLAVVGKIWGEDAARMLQLISEYDPQPPYDSGSPRTAKPELVARARKVLEPLTAGRIAAAKTMAGRFA